MAIDFDATFRTHFASVGRMLRPEQRSDLFTHAVEPTLQRELKHKGAANGDGSYSAELIGYIEIIGRQE